MYNTTKNKLFSGRCAQKKKNRNEKNKAALQTLQTSQTRTK